MVYRLVPDHFPNGLDNIRKVKGLGQKGGVNGFQFAFGWLGPGTHQN